MKKLTAADRETRSAEVVAENVASLKELFPEAFADGKIDFQVLKQLLGGAVDEQEEKFGLSWHGKRQARQLALTPSTGTLRPCPEESANWDETQNLMIEGDNLEVLKLLQRSYAGKVRLIYIDPPYNTGNDFVYPDDFRDSIGNYLMRTGQLESDGRKNTSNAESSGRFHTDWLNMVYPRLLLARTLLRKDGTIFISIDDSEVANLRLVCDAVFGPENFVAQLVWEGANKNDARQIGTSHEYVVVYARDRGSLPREWGIKKGGVEPVLAEVERLKAKHGDNYDAASEELAGWFRAMKATPSFAHRRYRYIDARGAYKEDDPTAPGGRRFELKHPVSGETIPLRPNRGWGFDQQEFERLVKEGRITFVTERSIMVRRYLHETDKLTPPSVFYQPARSASERLGRLMGGDVFSFPKDETILQQFVEMATGAPDEGALVMDFFAGSGTTAHAVWAQNAADGGNRKCVLVQLPEPLDPDSPDQAEAAAFCQKLKRALNIAELTKERLRRAAALVAKEGPAGADLGFRVFKLASSNMKEWAPRPESLPQDLEDAVEHLRTDRTEADILYEVLLKLGLDLCVPIQSREIAGTRVHATGGGGLLACLAEEVSRDKVATLAEEIVAWHKALGPAGDTTCIFRDNVFADDVAKMTLVALLKQSGLTNVQSL